MKLLWRLLSNGKQTWFSVHLRPIPTNSPTMATKEQLIPTKFCHYCGTKLQIENAKFCSECGQSLQIPKDGESEDKEEEKPEIISVVSHNHVYNNDSLTHLLSKCEWQECQNAALHKCAAGLTGDKCGRNVCMTHCSERRMDPRQMVCPQHRNESMSDYCGCIVL